MAKDTYQRKVVGSAEYDRLRSMKVLMVGAGGIGCELLKDLILSGFGEIHIVDLDTITLSNLNRQFLFRKKDIDKPKSLTVAHAVQSFNYYGAKLIPHNGNIMDTKLFPLQWWQNIDYIFNALDNLEARRYVNKMALFTGTPLMESGTTGFDGQIQPILPGKTECFECQPKETPTVYPVCTIRSTPSQPVHCIVWAKEFLFNQLFGENTESEVNVAQLSKETDDEEEIKRIVLEANELHELKRAVDSADFAHRVIVKIYDDDVEKALRLESLWKTRQKPVPIQYEAKHLAEIERMVLSNEAVADKETKLWSLAENLYVLYTSTKALQARNQGGESTISFDKDDEDTMNFVAAAANLRSAVFHIPVKTKFDIKQIAGNIIPAIATTNAIISGLSNLGLLTHVNSGPRSYKSIFISIRPNKRITGVGVEKPNPACATCSSQKGIAVLSEADLDAPLQTLVDDIGSIYGSEAFSLIVGKSRLLYDYDFTDNMLQSLRRLGIVPGEIVLVQDEDEELQNLELFLVGGPEKKFPAVKIGLKYHAPKRQESPDLDAEELNGEPPAKRRRKTEDAVVVEQVDDVVEVLD